MLRKRYVKPRALCAVTFELAPPELPASTHAQSVHLVGDFNDWNLSATPMTLRDEVFSVTLELEANRQFRFRYLINGHHWCNDWHADDYVDNGFGEGNCVVVTCSEETLSDDAPGSEPRKGSSDA